MKIKNHVLCMMAIASLMVSCNSHPKFETSVDAVEGCKKELAALKGEKEMSIEQLTKATSSWLETQDSAYSVFSRDTSINLRSPVALAFFVVSDSIRGELKRLAFSQPRSLNDVMYLKLNTATSSEKIEKTDAYKEAISFFERLDKQEVFPTLKETLRAYYYLLSKAKPFRTEEQLIEFISKEDKCFRSLMTHLNEVSNEHLQQLTDATSKVYDGLYDSVGKKADDVNDRTMLFLTMRFNRRIIQNAAACKEDIESGKKLDRAQRANYRWMLIQPFMAIDDYSTSALTKEQKKELLEISKYIPSLLSKLDLQKQSKEEEDKFTEVLSQYFLKSYLSTTL